jgi:hypothetical protein
MVPQLGPRDFNWRADAPASIYYTVAQDNGDPKVKADIRDKVFLTEAPFRLSRRKSMPQRFALRALTGEMNRPHWRMNGGGRTAKPLPKPLIPGNWQTAVLFDRSYEDRYSYPGQPDTRHNQYGREVLNLLPNNELIMVNAQGASPEGDRPFVSLLNVKTKAKQRALAVGGSVFRASHCCLDAARRVILTTRESPDESPNYFVRNLKARNAPVQVTSFPHPYPQLKGIQKQQLRYKRTDGC